MRNDERLNAVGDAYFTPEENSLLASGWSIKKNLLGIDVHNERKEHIGSISDIVVAGHPATLFAIVGVGGFLGVGKHEVAVPLRHFRVHAAELMLPGATQEALERLPAFEDYSERWTSYDFSTNTIDGTRRTAYEAQTGDVAPELPIASGHPVGTGIGATGGAIAGAAAGAAGGPLGSVAGAVVGAVVGGLAGQGVAEVINPEQEEAYWRQTYSSEPYYASEYSYDDYAPAYRAGYESRISGIGDWDSARAEWARRWDAEHAQGRLRWEKAEPAIKAAWERANRHYVQHTGY